MAGFNSSIHFNANFQTGFSPGVPFFGGGAPVGRPAGPRPGGMNPAQMQQMFQVLMGAMQQLAAGFQSFGGGQPMPGQFPMPGQYPGQQPFPGQNPGYQGFPSFPPQQQYPHQPFSYYNSPGTPHFGGHQPPQAPPPDPNLDFTKLSKTERTNLSGLNDKGRAALHLWGIQVTSAGKNDGGIYFNVLNNPDKFQKAEVDLVRDMYNKEMAMYGGVTGKLLDQHFFGVYQQQTGKDISQRYGNRPISFAQGPVDMDKRLSGQNGLSSFDNNVIRLWGHDSLDNGAQDGSVTEFTLTSQFALDKTDGSRGSVSQSEVQALLAADLADGRRDGNALEMSFIDSLDRVYFGGPGASVEKTLGRAGINKMGADSIIAQWAENPPPGIPPGVDITKTENIGKCPVLGPMVTQQGGPGGMQFS